MTPQEIYRAGIRVFIVGGSAFPQNAGNPPTETIGMLACWAADGIKDVYLKKQGAMV